MRVQATLIRILTALALLAPGSVASAQSVPVPWSANVELPTFVLPASAVNGGGVFSGQLLAPVTPTDCSAPGYSFLGDTDTGVGYSASNTVAMCAGGAATAGWATSGLFMTNGLALGWTDAFQTREAAGFLIQRNSTNAQREAVANTYTSSTNKETFDIDWQTTANQAIVGTRTAATGNVRILRFVAQESSAAANGPFFQLDRVNANPLFLAGYGAVASGAAANYGLTGTFYQVGVTHTGSSGTVDIFSVAPTINQSGTAGYTAFAMPIIETANGSGTRAILEMRGGASGTTVKTRFDNTGKASVWDSVATAGQGLSPIRAQATTGTVTNSGTASIATWTPGAADVEVEVSCRVNITVSTNHTFSCDVTYTDVANNARTRILPMFPISGTQLTGSLMTNAVGAGDFGSATIRIGVKASTAITVRTSSGGTFTTVTYTASGTIRQVG